MQENITYNEPELLRQIADGDENAFAEIYHHYFQQLYPFIQQMTRSEADTTEILQETFLRVWLSRDKLPGIDNFRAWIFRVSSRENLTWLRKQVKHDNKLSRFIANAGHELATETPEQLFDLSNVASLVKEAVNQMPTQRRKIYQLSRESGLKPDEIARELSISVNTVHNTLSAALIHIREFLARSGYTIPMLILDIILRR